MNELASNLAGKDVAIFVLTAAKEVKWVSAKLQGAAQVRNKAVLKGRFTCLPISEERAREMVRKRVREGRRKRDKEGGREEDKPV